MAKPNIGEMRLHDWILPALPAGRYRLQVDTEVKIDGAAQPLDGRAGHFEVDGPRFALAATEVSGLFPPRNGHGPFDEAIPHVALGRRTLPWERPFSAATQQVDGMPIPWMALLMFEDGECSVETKQKIGDRLPADVVARLRVAADTLVDTVTASRTLLTDLMPCWAELALLTHVREVNIDDRELGAGDSDGFFAVVMGNRVPRRGVKYRCCLVSVEERTDLVKREPPPAKGLIDLGEFVDNVFVENARQVDGLQTLREGFTLNTLAAGPDAAASFGERQLALARVETLRAGSERSIAKDKAVGIAAGRRASEYLGSASMVLLTTWTFECEGSASFRALMQALDVGMIGKPAPGGGPQLTDSGHLRVESINRAGAPETVFFRGPLVPAPLSRDPNGPYHSADQARRVAPEVGAEDVSYACAFEVGRLLAAANARLAQELMRWRRGGYQHAVRVDQLARVKTLLRVAELVDERAALGALLAVKAVARMNRGCPPLADPFDLLKLRQAPGFDADLLRQTFRLETLDQARALVGGSATLLDSVVSAAPLAFDPGQVETLETVMRDALGQRTLQDLRAGVLDNLRNQLRDFGRLVR